MAISFLDANACLRYLLWDIPEQAEQVDEAIGDGAATSLEFLSECAYVLSGRLYRFSRAEVSESLLSLLMDVDCEHPAVASRALELFADTNLDFPDCILIARHEIEGAVILTFDQAVRKRVSS